MKTNERQTTQTTVAHDDLTQAGKAGITAVMITGGLVGVWGMACMIAAFTTSGIGEIVTGFLTAITGM